MGGRRAAGKLLSQDQSALRIAHRRQDRPGDADFLEERSCHLRSAGAQYRDGAAGGDQAEIDWISFACVLIRREVVEQIGPMDEGFFMYFEDVDYCLRARSAGWQIAYVPSRVSSICAAVDRLNSSPSRNCVVVRRITINHGRGISPNITARPVRGGPICAGTLDAAFPLLAKSWEKGPPYFGPRSG